MPLTRRALLAAVPGAAVACAGGGDPVTPPDADARTDPLRLTARPDQRATATLLPGTTSLALGAGRPGLLHVPPGPARALVVVLHGAGGTAEHGLSLLLGHADARGLVLLAPASARSTWDAVTGDGRRDTAALDRALEEVLGRLPLPPDRLAVAGFSDGASCALTLGLSNGDLLHRVVAFSPGFSAARQRRGRPALMVTHGLHDGVLPIDRTSRRLVPSLRRAGYDVDYREFDGGHEVPPVLAEQAADWLAG